MQYFISHTFGPTDHLQHLISKPSSYFRSTFQNVHVSAPHKVMFHMYYFTSYFIKFKSSLFVECIFFLMNAAFAMTVLDSISHVHLTSFAITPHKQLKYSTFCSYFWSIVIFTVGGRHMTNYTVIKISLSKILSKMRIRKYLCDVVPSQSGLKQTDALSWLLSSYVSDYVVM
jgi:hypothetical protein